MAILYIDYENGDDNYAGTSFNPLASGTDGRISSYTFSSATANFPNNGSLAPTKNLFGVSEALEEVNAWNGNNITYTRSTINPPSGLFTSWDIKETTANNTHTFVSTITIAQFTIGTTYTISLYAKANGRNQVTLQFGDGTRSARFDLSNGTVAQTAANATAAISSVGDNWYRISITATATATSVQMILGLTNNAHNATSAQTYVGDTNLGVYISSPQIEASSSATSYEKPPDQRLTIWNGSSYLAYRIVQYINSTSLLINLIQSGAAIGNQSVDRQYYIGGRWKTINTGATGARLFQGDEVRIMSSPDPTLVGNATFTSSVLQGTFNISSSTNSTPISVTTSANHGYSTGDTIVITGHTTNTNANGTWEITVTGLTTFTLNNSTGNGVGGAAGTTRLRNNTVIRLASPVTANIASLGNRGNGRTAWIASANVTATLDTGDFKEGDCADNIAIAAGFTTGKAAYKSTGNLDLSGYQQVSFWIKNTAGAVPTTGNLSLRLCTDTIGDTSVHTVAIPALVVANRWVPITVNLATNLNSAIQSVALYVDSDIGAQTILLCNIIACKASSSADSLTLQSLIGKNTVSEGWWGGIQSINGTRVMLDNETNTIPTSANNRGYIGTSETTSLYKRETIKTPMAITSTATVSTPNRSGFLNNPISTNGGYDRTNMSVISGMTFFDGLNSFGYGLYYLNRSYTNVSNFGFVRYNTGYYVQSAIDHNISNIVSSNNSGNGTILYQISNANVTNIISSFNTGVGLQHTVNSMKCNLSNIITNGNINQGFLSEYSSNSTLTNCISHNNVAVGINIVHSATNRIKNCIANLNGQRGLATGGGASNNMFINCSTSGNVGGSIQGQGQGDNFFKDCIFLESSVFTIPITYTNSKTVLINSNNTTNNYYNWTDGGVIYNSAAIRYSNSGFSWAMSPTSTTRNSSYPLDFPIAKIAVSANSLVTVKAWMRRSNILLTTGLRIKGGQIAGVPNDITSYMTAAADTWQQVTLNFTPTEVGVVEILAECYGGSTFTAYVDDISVTQV